MKKDKNISVRVNERLLNECFEKFNSTVMFAAVKVTYSELIRFLMEAYLLSESETAVFEQYDGI